MRKLSTWILSIVLIVLTFIYCFIYCSKNNIYSNMAGLFIFLSYLLFTISIIGCATKESRKTILDSYNQNKHLPKIIDIITYCSIIIMLASTYHYWLATMYLIIASIDLNNRAEAIKLKIKGKSCKRNS